ncbi:dihydrofolate reductase family protein [Actinomycetospora sp. CA-084318]|uniref:dihydrofolate reductase family protein n=1 Tax=Actinomycetospora sp. CA-084318 TaxID=3239892 RepID=UPI003D966EE3
MPRQIVITQNITLDGVVEALDWFTPEGDGDVSDLMPTLVEAMDREVAFLAGRRTFEEMRGYWPAQTDDTTGITAHLDAVEKLVVSSTLTDPAWANSTVLRGGAGLADDVAGLLKEGPDGDIGVTGSIELCHALLAADLVDELRLYTYPVVLGRGRRLFPDGVGLRPRLVDSRAFRSGVSLQTYRLHG